MMTKLQETPVNVSFVLDDKSPRPRIRIEVGTWCDFEVMPPTIFFQVCAEYWKNKTAT
jgi:hypothetical protein